MLALSRQARAPLVAAGDVHYHVPERQALYDVLTATRLGSTVAEVGKHRFTNAERHLKSPEAMAALFSRAPEAIRRTVEVAGRVQFSLDELRYEYPEELAPPGMTPIEYLARLVRAGARKRYPGGVPQKVRRLVEHELAMIGELHYEAYFLTVWDLVRFARRRGILCQGRGSAANSAVCYCLGITSVDPERMAQEARQEPLPLFDGKDECKMTNDKCKMQIQDKSRSAEKSPPRQGVPLPKMSPAQEVLADYRTTGLSLRAHPMSFLRKGLEGMGAVPAERLATWPNGKPVRVAGIVLVRQRPGTAKGITFVTLEDETGTANLIMRPDVWKKFRAAALGATVLLAQGRLQREGLVIHVLVTRLENLSGRMQELTSQSRDFC